MWREQEERADLLFETCRTWHKAHLAADFQPLCRKTADPTYKRIEMTAHDILELEVTTRAIRIRLLKGAQVLWRARHGDTCPRQWQEEIAQWERAGGQDLHDLILAESWRW